MASELIDQEGLPKIPNLEYAELLYKLQNKHVTAEEKNEAKNKLIKGIEENNMAPFYEHMCNELQLTADEGLMSKMKEANAKEIEKLEEAVKDAEENLGEIEIRDAKIAKAEYFSKIGDKDGSLKALREAYEKTTTLGHKLDNVFHQIRIGFFFLNNDVISRNLTKAKSLIEEGGDWDRRNRLKVYQGYYSMTIRDFKTAAASFLDSISTFTSYELMEYKRFVVYTVVMSTIALDRTELRTKVVQGAEIQEQMHQLPLVKKYLTSLYDCHYADFFQALAEVELDLKKDRLLAPHYTYYVREMRILAYTQLLESYSSLTLDYMAKAFGVTTEFIDRELARFIAAGRLNCKIDKVGGIVETNRPDSKNYQYQCVVKQGDNLLNRIQKLSRVINL
eukprot:gene5997-6693_t